MMMKICQCVCTTNSPICSFFFFFFLVSTQHAFILIPSWTRQLLASLFSSPAWIAIHVTSSGLQ